MSKIEKAVWSTDHDQMRLAMPLTKINEEKRQVSGFASLDNADTQNDVVLSEASQKAFSRFRGNIREMHQPIAVGRMVDFVQDDYIDSDGTVYKGIYVTVRVSKGAEDTWQKVLDGTLTGFSIGGNILDSESQFVKDAGKNIRFVKDYELVELSLVDNPANQLANVFSIEKSADGSSFVKGMIAETKSENIFICKEDEIAKTSSAEEMDCPVCELPMLNKGWFEYMSDQDKAAKVSAAVKKYLESDTQQESPANDEGGVEVADTVEKDATGGQVVPDETPVGEAGQAQSEVNASVETETETVEEPVEVETEEAAADVSEVDSAEDDLVKMFDGLRDELNKSLTDNFGNVTESIKKVDEKFAEFSTNVENKFAELESRHSELSQKFAGLKEKIDTVEKSVGNLDGETAFRKSGTLGGDSETVVEKKTTSDWGGHFLSVDSLQD